MSFNRIANCHNKFQGSTKKVLCICSAGLLRSPTAAVVLSHPPFNFNTRAAGLSKEYALIYADDVLLEWADEFVVMNQDQMVEIKSRVPGKPVFNLDIPDRFPYRDLDLMKLIAERYREEISHKDVTEG